MARNSEVLRASRGIESAYGWRTKKLLSHPPLRRRERLRERRRERDGRANVWVVAWVDAFFDACSVFGCFVSIASLPV